MTKTVIKKNKIGIVIQARNSSKRLPGKVLMDILGKPMLYRQIQRLKYSFDERIPIIVATSIHDEDTPIFNLCKEIGTNCFRGNLNDVVDRFIECAARFGLTHIIRVGGDDPLIDPECCKYLIEKLEYDYDFLYASHKNGWPYGCAAELISVNSLKKIKLNTNNPLYLEHTIPYFFDNPSKFKIKKVNRPFKLPDKEFYLSVDYKEDIELVREVFKKLWTGVPFSMAEIINLFENNQELTFKNSKLHNGFER